MLIWFNLHTVRNTKQRLQFVLLTLVQCYDDLRSIQKYKTVSEC